MSSGEAGTDSGMPLDAARLQPVSDDIFDHQTTGEEKSEADRIDRLAGDRDLIGELRRRGFDGPEYQRAAEELVRYGLAVMTAWMHTGTIFEKCARRGRPVERPPTGRSRSPKYFRWRVRSSQWHWRIFATTSSYPASGIRRAGRR